MQLGLLVWTTATIFDNTNHLMIDQAIGNGSTPYNFSIGHLNLALAMDPMIGVVVVLGGDGDDCW